MQYQRDSGRVQNYTTNTTVTTNTCILHVNQIANYIFITHQGERWQDLRTGQSIKQDTRNTRIDGYLLGRIKF